MVKKVKKKKIKKKEVKKVKKKEEIKKKEVIEYKTIIIKGKDLLEQAKKMPTQENKKTFLQTITSNIKSTYLNFRK